MRYIFSLFILFGATTAHSQCSEFDNLLKKGDNYLKGTKPNYQEAINAYTAAILACSDRAGEAKQRITRMVNDINKLKESAVAAEKKATEAQKETALERDKAQTAREEAERNLQKFETASAEIIDAIAREANQNILKMNYPAAADKLRTATAFNKPTVAFIQAVQEVAFFWTESGKLTHAADLLRDTKQGAVPETRDALRAFLKKMDAGYYAELEKRYLGDMVPIKGGTFKFGQDKKNYIEGTDAKIGTDVAVNDFRIARTETTFWQFGLFWAALGRDIGKKAEASWGYEGHDPIINVSWYEALEYANWLTASRGLNPVYIIDSLKKNNYENLNWIILSDSAATGYRLPSEVEWEYAARGGQDFVYSGSDDLEEVAWYGGNANRTHPVQTRKANGYQLSDMSGNVWEWCWDWYGNSLGDLGNDYPGPFTGSARVLRGGDWHDAPKFCRVAYQNTFVPDTRHRIIGFRLALQ